MAPVSAEILWRKIKCLSDHCATPSVHLPWEFPFQLADLFLIFWFPRIFANLSDKNFFQPSARETYNVAYFNCKSLCFYMCHPQVESLMYMRVLKHAILWCICQTLIMIYCVLSDPYFSWRFFSVYLTFNSFSSFAQMQSRAFFGIVRLHLFQHFLTTLWDSMFLVSESNLLMLALPTVSGGSETW